MDYQSNFDLDARNNIALFKEKFKDKETGKIRKNEHILYMESEPEIVAMAQNAGFIVQAKIDLIKLFFFIFIVFWLKSKTCFTAY